MNLHWIDWAIVSSLLLLMLAAVFKTKSYVKSVADFLAANRCAGRYLISVSDTMALIGAVTIVASFEAYYRTGFTWHWWGMLGGVMFFVSLSGWVQYRFRQTRALTMAQFLEMRYNKSFRVLFGMQSFFAGVLGFGIFPAVGGRFFKHFCGFPEKFVSLGPIEIDVTLGIIMAVLLIVSLYFTFAGGQIAVILTDFIQGTFSNIAFLLVMVFLLINIPWETFYDTVVQRPIGESMIDPFDTAKYTTFDMWFFVMHIILLIWYYMADQTNQGYNSSAINAHEARMAKAMGVWRMGMQGVPIVLVAVMAYVLMNNGAYEGIAAQARSELAAIDNPTIRTQVTTCVVMAKYLPVGLLGAMCAVMLASFISTHDTCLHSWGSIFIQDILLPLRSIKKGTQDTRLTPERHIRWLKYSACGVALWVFLFSLLFAQFNYIWMFFDLMAILGAGAGAVIVFGLYWKRGTTAAAFASMISGFVLFFVCTVLSKMGDVIYPVLFPGGWEPNERHLRIAAMLVTIGVYVGVSLFRRGYEFNMDKMLHRGKYAVESDIVKQSEAPTGWLAKIGITEEFSLKDKMIYFFFSTWQVWWFIFFAVVIVIRKCFYEIPDTFWSWYWKYSTWMNVVLAAITLVWFTFGGIRDLKTMFYKLRTQERDANDDGEIVEQDGE